MYHHCSSLVTSGSFSCELRRSDGHLQHLCLYMSPPLAQVQRSTTCFPSKQSLRFSLERTTQDQHLGYKGALFSLCLGQRLQWGAWGGETTGEVLLLTLGLGVFDFSEPGKKVFFFFFNLEEQSFGVKCPLHHVYFSSENICTPGNILQVVYF